MAFIKEESLPTGATAKYWIISNVSVSKITNSATIQVLGYPSQQARLDNPRSSSPRGARKTFNISTEDFETIYQRVVAGNENVFRVLYKYIKGVERGDDSIANPVYWEDAEGNLSWFSDATSDHHDVP
jgi:hypothetical protein